MTIASEPKIRSLTNDEKKAAEAAFRGAPFNPKWSEAARKVYRGISSVMSANPNRCIGGLPVETEKTNRSTPVVGSKSRTRAKSKIL